MQGESQVIAYIEMWNGLIVGLKSNVSAIHKKERDGDFLLVINYTDRLIGEDYNFRSDKESRDNKYNEILSKLTK